MATQKISEMTEAIILQDEDYVPIVQSGLNRKIKIEYLRDYNKLHNKPTLNGVTIENNKKLSDYNVVKANQGIKVNSNTNQTLELEVPTNQELEQRSDVNKAITIATADKMAKETAHQTMSKEYQPNSQDNLTEGENQPVSYKAVKDYVDVLENKVDENERDIEDKVQKLDEKTAAKDSELENLISTNEEDIESKVQELDNKKLNKEETPKTLPNPNKLIFTGAVSDEYDGSVEKTINIPEGGSDYTLPQANENQLGGIKAKAKTDETVEVVIDTETGKLYVPTYPKETGGSGLKVGVQTIVKHTVSLEEADVLMFYFSSDEYPLIKKCNYFFIRIKNPTNKNMPYIIISINGKKVQGNGGNVGYSRHNIRLVDNYAYVGVSGWESITLYNESLPYTSAVEKFPPIILPSLDKITIGVGSWTKFLDEGAIIFIQGWHD